MSDFTLHDSTLTSLLMLPTGDMVLSFEDVDGNPHSTLTLMLRHGRVVERTGGAAGSVVGRAIVPHDGAERHLSSQGPTPCDAIRIELQQMPYSEDAPGVFTITCSAYFAWRW
ncbi:MAG: hypothetical protein H6721_15140 [Sandaracinus sp.]|nr:hypothetical protein [Sandaracinus sp.]MCB9633449.1 hypothetical protein [Sandaracinus sp.]